jgi:lipopolysaccharide transport system permease protein
MGDNSENQVSRRWFQHQDLLIRFTIRAIERQTKGSWLGILWVLVNPLLSLALYTVVFGIIMGGDFEVRADAGPLDFPLGIFIGLSVLGLITETMGSSPMTILSSQNLVKKVVFPLYVLPMAHVGSIAFKTLMSALLAVIGVQLVGPGLTWQALWFPVILLPIILLALGLGWLISALGVYFRDSQQITGFFGMALFYASAVFYPSHIIPPGLYTYLKWNPVLQAVELSRDVLLWNIPLDPEKLLYVYAFSLGTGLLGFFSFQALRSGFADVL